MKKLITILIFSFLVISTFAQIKIYPKDAVETGFLYDLSYQLSGIEKFDGTEKAAAVSLASWNQLYLEISKSNLTEMEFAPVAKINHKAQQIIRKDIVPLGLLLFRYNVLDENPADLMDDQGILNLSEAKIYEKLAFATTAFNQKSYNGNEVTFRLDNDFVYSNFKEMPDRLFINFDDGQGWQDLTPGKEMQVSYQTTGIKNIQLKAAFAENDGLFSSFKFNVVRLITPPPTATWLIEADLSYDDSIITGDGFVLLSDQNTKLTKPIIVSEGIDLDGSTTWESLYQLLNQQNMLEDLRSQGFDLVVLNFHDPLTYIQNNAYLMMKLIQMVNDTTDYSSELTVIGPSMGGMVTRYALTYMENHGIDHNTSLFISFEAPNQGANIPLGLQYEIYFFKDLDASIQIMLDLLDYPAPQQMLAYRYTDPPSSPAGHNSFYDTFQNELAAMGSYPSNLRKIAISNGRGDGIGQDYNAGDQVIFFEYNSLLVDIRGNSWAVENNASGQILEGLIDYLFGTDKQLNVTVFSPKPYDNAPGGSRPTFADIDSLESPIGDIIALHQRHAYIPTISGLDIAMDDLFYNVSSDPQIMQKTPFDSIYWAADNYDHVFISAQTASRIIAEILESKIKRQNISFNPGWNDLSGYIDPTVDNIEDFTSQFGENLIIMQHFDEIFWPDGGINTLENWNYKNGYLIKLNAGQEMEIEGAIPTDKTIQVTTGWNLIPVLATSPIAINELFAGNTEKIKVIKEGIGVSIFWPEAGVNTLSHLIPGSAYFLYATEDFQITFH